MDQRPSGDTSRSGGSLAKASSLRICFWAEPFLAVWSSWTNCFYLCWSFNPSARYWPETYINLHMTFLSAGCPNLSLCAPSLSDHGICLTSQIWLEAFAFVSPVELCRIVHGLGVPFGDHRIRLGPEVEVLLSGEILQVGNRCHCQGCPWKPLPLSRLPLSRLPLSLPHSSQPHRPLKGTRSGGRRSSVWWEGRRSLPCQ